MPDNTSASFSLLIIPAFILVGLTIYYFFNRYYRQSQSFDTHIVPPHQNSCINLHPLPVNREDDMSDCSPSPSIYSYMIPDNLITTTTTSTDKSSSLTEFRAFPHSEFIQGSSQSLVIRPDSPILPRPDPVLILPSRIQNLYIPPPPNYPPPNPPMDVSDMRFYYQASPNR